ncbi:Low molecular weight protein tyrosine phosphatase [Paenibacillus pasadenensis]|uniref:protein-tyrosine-phosphatase n=1 Tax=Paenibacillus pasadenensis TaxID=217090 RepID=A0A2N5N672_9BACL|nr:MULTISPECIES: low molecular weight protein-tyrosine-phosphatase [Paenibacillus]PLT45857.1 Low molecular weight protein tyrosine phosphatase [Paenibacillus pasadenensis]QGG56286.1 low molecular weight phosphotyrosine protein phosphatase [Paenibacillus sp. B01]
MASKVNVVFVCLGNICRSPMAEAVLRHLAARRGLEQAVVVDSAGTGDWHLGAVPHEGTRRELDRAGISYEGMRARLVDRDDLERADYIVVMDRANERDVRELIRAGGIVPQGKLLRFMELLPDEELDGVPDPYYTGDFEQTRRLVAAGCEALLDRIEREFSA